MSESEQKMGDDLTGGYAPEQPPENAPEFVRKFYEFINDFLRHTPHLTPLVVANAAREWVRRNHTEGPAA